MKGGHSGQDPDLDATLGPRQMRKDPPNLQNDQHTSPLTRRVPDAVLSEPGTENCWPRGFCVDSLADRLLCESRA